MIAQPEVRPKKPIATKQLNFCEVFGDRVRDISRPWRDICKARDAAFFVRILTAGCQTDIRCIIRSRNWASVCGGEVESRLCLSAVRLGHRYRAYYAVLCHLYDANYDASSPTNP